MSTNSSSTNATTNTAGSNSYPFERRRSGSRVTVTDQPRAAESIRKIGEAACIAVMITVALVLFFWSLRLGDLVAVVPGLMAMTPSTALALGAAAFCLWLRRSPQTSQRSLAIAKSGAILVTTFGLIQLVGCFAGGDDALGIALRFGATAVAPNTAMCFVLLGFTALALDSSSEKMKRTAQAAAVFTALISITALLGYAYHIEGFYEVTGLVPMALHTAFGFVLLSIAVLLLRPETGTLALMSSDTMGGVLARRLLPACVGVPVILGMLSVVGQNAGFFSAAVGAAGVVLVVSALLVTLVWRNAVLLVRMEIDRKQMQEQLQKAKAAAESANQLKSAFFANISHEIRTPLTAIVGFADLYFTPGRDLQEKTEYVDRIRRSGEHLLTIINDILDLSKIEAGKIQVETLVCSPVEIVAGVASLLRAKALNKNLTLEVEYDGPIPRTIRTDPTRLRQSLLNLVSNSIKFTETGGVRMIVSMATKHTDPEPRLQVQVIDSGIGIAPELQKNLFQPFVQADASMTRRFGGTGLGLNITRHLAELLGGGVTLESEVGKGSRFTLTIATGSLTGVTMLEDPAEAMSRELATNTDNDLARAIRVEGNILLAEDGTENQALISAYLRGTGANVDLAINGQVAIDKAAKAWQNGRPYDLVLMDIQMPVVDGFQATLRLREKGYRGPIVALTANAMPADRTRCLNMGCNDFLSKPIDPTLLLRTVANYLRPAAANREAA